MSFAFDLISDIHAETWPDFDWTDRATSPYCVVAGDLARDRDAVTSTLRHLGSCYQAVFYVDGNDEHRYYYDDLNTSYADLANRIRKIPNVVFLQDNVVVVDGVAILGTNGWWTYDFDPGIDAEQTSLWFQDQAKADQLVARCVSRMAMTDATYMLSSIRRLQTHNDVKKIVCVTHTVPNSSLISHDIGLADTFRFNTMGNSLMMRALTADTENKLHTWCFGHYHRSVDRVINNVRYVNNCRGRGNTPWSQTAYYPKRITIDY
jgi:predicted phosphohydrolase